MVDSKICKCLHNISSLGLEIAQWYHHDTTKAQVTENTLHCGGYSKKVGGMGKKISSLTRMNRKYENNG